MTLPTLEKDREDLYQSFFEQNDFSQPLIKKNPSDSIEESHENSYLFELGRTVFTNFLIIAGAWFSLGSSALLFYNFVLKPHSTLPRPLEQPILFIGGLILLFLKLGTIKKKSDLILYSIIPLMGIIFSILFDLGIKDLPIAQPFFWSLMVFYVLTLVIFFYVKDYIEKSYD